MRQNNIQDKLRLISSMLIFGTIGIFRRYIPLSSSIVALTRGIIGTLFLLAVVLFQRKGISKKEIKSNFMLLFISGTAIGFNWILLFEAYCYTSVATATLCYYLAPIMIIFAAPFVIKEKITMHQGICAAAAICGMIPISGVLQTGFSGSGELKGILFGIGAAILYASVILMNKKMGPIDAFSKTIIQLFFASIMLLPYVLATEEIHASDFTVRTVSLLGIIGAIHTGLAYWMYFSSIRNLKAHTVALWSYLDPVLAIILSMVVLHEPMTVLSWVGAVVILGAAYLSEK